jgi:hypothetical protein
MVPLKALLAGLIFLGRQIQLEKYPTKSLHRSTSYGQKTKAALKTR